MPDAIRLNGGKPDLLSLSGGAQQGAQAQQQAASASKQAAQASLAAAKASGDAAKAQTQAAQAELKSVQALAKASAELNALIKALGGSAGSSGQPGGGGGSGGFSQFMNSQSKMQNTLSSFSKIFGNGANSPVKALDALLGKSGIAGRIPAALGSLLPEAGEALAAIAAFSNPVTEAIGAITAASAAVVAFGKQVADTGTTFANLQNALGSSSAITAQAHLIGAASGLSDNQVGSLAQSIAERIGPGGNPLAQAYASQLGVYTIGRPFAVDEGTNVVKIADALASIKDMTNRIRTARAIGAEGLLPYTELSQKQRGYMASDQQTQMQIFDPTFIQNSLDFQNSIGRVGDALKNLLAAVGKPELAQLTQILNGIASGIDLFARVVSSAPVQAMISQVLAPFELMAAGVSALDKTFGAAAQTTAQNPAITALQANTQAIMDNTKVLATPGQFGHSPRLAGALPAAYGFGSGLATAQMLALGRGLRMGGFAA